VVLREVAVGKSKQRAKSKQPRRANEEPDPPGTFVLEVQGDEVSAVGADGISEAERQRDIRLDQRLTHFEAVSRRILANPQVEHGRRWRAEVLLRETLEARAEWASGTRPDARMANLERIAGVLDVLTMLPLAAQAKVMRQGRQRGSHGALWGVLAEYSSPSASTGRKT
jgi:hypothetical protein